MNMERVTEHLCSYFHNVCPYKLDRCFVDIMYIHTAIHVVTLCSRGYTCMLL
jgi:hypothetical protein